jgi:uncharacterized membrane protein
MKRWMKAIRKSLRRRLRAHLITGLIALVPIGITFLVLRFFFEFLDGLLQPVIQLIWGRTFPGAGVIALLILAYGVGMLTSNVLGRRLFDLVQNLLLRTPIVQTVYSAFKGVVDSVARTGKTPFQRPVLVEYPRRGMWSLGFLTGGPVTTREGSLLAVYLPSTPTPTTGYVLLVPREEVMWLEMTVEEAMRLIVSSGVLTPEELEAKNASLDTPRAPR